AATNSYRATVTDAQGRFVFATVDSGAYVVAAHTTNHLAASVAIHVGPAAATPDTVTADLSLTATGTLTGQVLLQYLTSLENTIVALDSTPYLAVTRVDGGWQIEDVPVASWTVRAIHSGYFAHSLRATLHAAGEHVVVPPLVLAYDPALIGS